MVDAGHRIEQVGRRRRPGGIAGARLIERSPPSGRPRRPRRRSHSQAMRSRGARQLGRDGDQPEPVEPRLDRRVGHVGRHEQVSVVVRARRFASARNGPSRLNPSGCAPSSGASGSQPGPARRRRSSVADGRLTAVGRNDVTPRDRRRAGHPVERARVAHRVVAAPAVDVDIDEPGRDVAGRGTSAAASSRSIAVISPSVTSIVAAGHPVVEDEPPADDAPPVRAGQRPSGLAGDPGVCRRHDHDDRAEEDLANGLGQARATMRSDDRTVRIRAPTIVPRVAAAAAHDRGPADDGRGHRRQDVAVGEGARSPRWSGPEMRKPGDRGQHRRDDVQDDQDLPGAGAGQPCSDGVVADRVQHASVAGSPEADEDERRRPVRRRGGCSGRTSATVPDPSVRSGSGTPVLVWTITICQRSPAQGRPGSSRGS